MRGSTKMQKLVIVAAFMFVGSFAASGALAQPAPKQPAGGGQGQGKVKVYDFSGDTIEGDLIKPEGSTVDARDFAKHGSLIRIRTHFIPEIIKSAEDL